MRSRGRRWVWRWVLCVGASASACASVTPPASPPVDSIHWQLTGALPGHHCDDAPLVGEGRLPDGARSLGVVRMSGRARPLRVYQAELSRLAHQRCAEGATVRSAVDDGAGVVALEAVLWERAAAPSPR